VTATRLISLAATQQYETLAVVPGNVSPILLCDWNNLSPPLMVFTFVGFWNVYYEPPMSDRCGFGG
jgi:hypothetical protein